MLDQIPLGDQTSWRGPEGARIAMSNGHSAFIAAPGDTEASRAVPGHPVHAIVAVAFGNALEWFDIVIYGFLAATIAKLFFPSGDETVSLLLTLGTFGVSFVMRPLGSIVLGAYADRAGRKRALTLSIAIMMLGTAMIAAAPTYASIGVLAPVILLIARLLQGFSVGGEFGSSTALLAEQDPARRGFYSAWQPASQGLTTLLASAFGVALSTLLKPEQVADWGWRVPFIFGLLIGPIALYIRITLHEGEEYTASRHVASPLRAAFGSQKLRMVIAMGLVILATATAYTMLLMPIFAARQLGIPPFAGFTATLIYGALVIALCPVFGRLSDRVGRVPVMTVAAVLMLLCVVPLFGFLLAHRSAVALYIVQAILATLASIYSGPFSAAMAELFPPATRSTGLSISYSFGVAIFGGFAPFIVTWLVSATGSDLAPSFYVAAGAALSLIALVGARRAGVR
jgi:MHS family proline/betaine transporter-like MFS transporter